MQSFYNPHGMPTFKTEMLHLVVMYVQLIKWLLVPLLSRAETNIQIVRVFARLAWYSNGKYSIIPCSSSTVTHDTLHY